MTPEEKIARDKESVKALVGAKGAMEAALNRISVLEARLNSIDYRVRVVGDTIGSEQYIKVRDYQKGADVMVNTSDYIKETRRLIAEVL